MARWAILGTLLLCAACAGQDKFRPTMEADPPEIGIEGLVLMNELARGYREDPDPNPKDGGQKLCKIMQPSYQERAKYSYQRYNKTSGNQLPACYIFEEDEPIKVARHVRAGFALTDLYCDTFFRRIAARSSHRRFSRSVTNDVGAAISAVLGLASAGSGVTGGVGAAFGLADGAFRNYDESFLVATDLPGLQKLVRKEQERFREDTLLKMPANYPDATTAIVRYANICSFTGMRGLLNLSVAEKADPFASQDRMVEAVAAYQAMAEQIATKKAEMIRAAAEREAALKAQAQKEAAARAAAEAAETESGNTTDSPAENATEPADTPATDTEPGISDG